jgi:hypothetical protein
MTTQNALNTQLVLPAGSTAISQLLYTSAANMVSGLATANNGILVTSNTGVPSVTATLGQGLSVASSQLSVGGANNIPFNTGKGFQDNNGNNLLLFTVTTSAVNYWNMINNSIGNPPILSATGTDGNVSAFFYSKGVGTFNFGSNAGSNNLLVLTPVASAVNYITIGSSITAANPFVQAIGSDTNVVLKLAGQGNGGVQTQGTTAGGNATAGYVGEEITSVIASGSAVSLVTATPKNLTSISLTAGDWDVYGNVTATDTVTTINQLLCWISTTSATVPDASLYNGFSSLTLAMAIYGTSAPYVRISISTTTTVYISAQSVFASGTVTMQGGIYARRVR